jgi:EAL domain-containing protein (putative c-di-GMP-specific phosphodiesterase class I)
MVIAEGIETESQMHALLEMGCVTGQGFLMGRPCAPEVLEDLFLPSAPAPAADGSRAPQAVSGI